MAALGRAVDGPGVDRRDARQAPGRAAPDRRAAPVRPARGRGAGPPRRAARCSSAAELRAATREEGEDATRARRIDTDDPAVRLMTVHGAKGLEFAVVLCPFIQRTGDDKGRPTVWRDGHAGGRLVDAGGGAEWADDPPRRGEAGPRDPRVRGRRRGVEAAALRRAHEGEASVRGVVAPRARARPSTTRRAPGAALRPRRATSSDPAAARGPRGRGVLRRAGEAALEALRGHVAAMRGAEALEVAALGRTGADTVPVEGRCESPRRGRDARRRDARPPAAVRDRRCSFSSLVAEHTALLRFDAPRATRAPPTRVPRWLRRRRSGRDPFGGLRGTAFGSAVHEALEAALARRPTERFDDVATRALEAALRQRSLGPSDVAAHGLMAAAAAPLPGGATMRRAAAGRRGDRAALRHAGRRRRAARLAGRALAALDAPAPSRGGRATSRLHRATRLAESLVGSIDLVATLSGAGRYDVVDYKTNMLSTTPGGYGTAALHAAMRAADYPLQAALYLVALHRYLRWRLPDYDPSSHLGGAHYLFLRGMGPTRPTASSRGHRTARDRVAVGPAGGRSMMASAVAPATWASKASRRRIQRGLRAARRARRRHGAPAQRRVGPHAARRGGARREGGAPRARLRRLRRARHRAAVVHGRRCGPWAHRRPRRCSRPCTEPTVWSRSSTRVHRCPKAGSAPVVLSGPRCYLRRYALLEQLVADRLRARDGPRRAAPELEAALGSLAGHRRRLAGRGGPRRAASTVSVVAGGPGTGKTTTIALLLRRHRRSTRPSTVALAAPTGKAAARLDEAVRLGDRRAGARATSPVATTIHRLLGIGRDGRHVAAGTPLERDARRGRRGVDGLAPAARRAAGPRRVDARVVLVGDPTSSRASRSARCSPTSCDAAPGAHGGVAVATLGDRAPIRRRVRGGRARDGGPRRPSRPRRGSRRRASATRLRCSRHRAAREAVARARRRPRLSGHRGGACRRRDAGDWRSCASFGLLCATKHGDGSTRWWGARSSDGSQRAA